MGMSSHILDWWALELQQFNVKFEHIQGKKNVVADVISRLRAFGLYQDNDNEEVQVSLKDTIENIIEEIHSIEPTSKIPAYTKINKLHLSLLRKEQLHDKFCKKKVNRNWNKTRSQLHSRWKQHPQESGKIKIYSWIYLLSYLEN